MRVFTDLRSDAGRTSWNSRDDVYGVVMNLEEDNVGPFYLAVTEISMRVTLLRQQDELLRYLLVTQCLDVW